MALDERLRDEIARLARPADPSGVYEELIRRKEQRRIARRIQAGGLALFVVVATVGGLYGLSRVFSAGEPGSGIGSASNGLLAVSLFQDSDLSLKVATMQPDGSDLRPLTGTDGRDFGAAWSPDGARIAFWRSSSGGPAGVWLMNADGSDAHVIYRTHASIGTIAWSPDGTRIAFVNVEIPEGTWTELDLSNDLYVMNADGSDVTSVTTQGQITDFAWSPDATRLVIERQYPTGDNTLGYDLFLLDADGLNEVRLTHDGTSRDPAWSPDGSTIVFVGSDTSEFRDADLFAVAADGSQRRQLTDDDAIEADPTWAPDGSKLVFTRHPNNKDASCELVVATPDGTDELVIADEGSLDGCPVSLSWQPVQDTPLVIPNVTTGPATGPTGAATGEDIGLGFPVCNVSSIDGRFVALDAKATVFVATKIGDTGPCPQTQDGLNVVALDADQDGLADTSFGPIECELGCRAFSAPDLDGDGTDELLVDQSGASIAGLRLYDVSSAGEITPVEVSPPGDPDGGFEPGAQAVLWLGGDAFDLFGLQCGDLPEPDGPGVVATDAESLPHDSPDAEWHAHETTLVLQDDGLLHVVDVRDFTEPVTDDPAGPSFASGETLCGANLGP